MMVADASIVLTLAAKVYCMGVVVILSAYAPVFFSKSTQGYST